MITVSFPCPHASVEWDEGTGGTPQCPICGERRVSRVQAPAPRFRGCRGPSADGERLTAIPVTLGPPLRLKES